MNHKRYLYGSLGFLSLLGFIGVFTDQRYFLGFFAFAVDFEYFFAAGRRPERSTAACWRWQRLRWSPFSCLAKRETRR